MGKTQPVNESEIVISLPIDPILNKVYDSRSFSNSWENWIIFINMFDNVDVDKEGKCREEVVFTSFAYPGLIQGTIKLIEPNGTVLVFGEFDFIAE
jgi:hypothetical protein